MAHITGPPNLPPPPPPFPANSHGMDHSTKNTLNGHTMGPPSAALPPMQVKAPPPSSPQPTALVKDGRKYELVVSQQPVRARMCGFGDKDRRPITPPPCVQLIITDASTGELIPQDQIEPAFFVLSVDLWDETGTQEKNIVRAAANTQPATSISTATTTSYPPTPDRMRWTTNAYLSQGQLYSAQPIPVASYNQPQQPMGQPYPGQPQHMYQQQMVPQSTYQHYMTGMPSAAQVQPGHPQYMTPLQFGNTMNTINNGNGNAQNNSMFTRNLIGSLTVNAFTLHDEQGRTGQWFILSDLSVRTEGVFRLKMNFIDVGSLSGGSNSLNHGRAPVLATAFSAPFHVFTAKKFPGVIESTALSKCFAGQGIKIPIRKEGDKKGGDGDSDAGD